MIAKTFPTRANFFLQCSSLFLREFVSIVYLLRVNDGTVPEAILRLLGGEAFFRLFTLDFRQKMRLLSDEKLFFGQRILLAENVVKGPGQNNFGPAYWYHLSLVTKNIIKVDLMKNSVSTGQRWSPRGHILKSLASKPQVLKNCPVLGWRTALFLNR